MSLSCKIPTWLTVLAGITLGILAGDHAFAAAKFPQFPGRSTVVLDGSWQFVWLGDTNLAELDPLKVRCTDMAAVPGVFDTSAEHYGRRGTGVYRRQVSAPAGALRLKFGGLGLYAKVWWDDRLIGEIKLPYSSVDIDFANPTAGLHTLTVVVDNRFSDETAPLFKPSYDFYAYGGIYRGVSLQTLPSRRLERVQVTTIDPVSGRIRLSLSFAGMPDGQAVVGFGFDGAEPTERQIQVSGNAATFETSVPAARVWSPAQPHLHTLSVALGADRVIDRFGLRVVKTVGREIMLNGQPLRIKGVNRHESHPEFGPVQNTHLMLEDLQLVRALGGNFIRCVHYQHDPEFYELCDEAGMLVWAESLGWGLNETAVLQLEPLLIEETRILGQVVANHPSVIFTAFLNECAADKPRCLPVYKKLAAALRDTAPGTLVTFAANRIKSGVCYGVCDVVSVNYYPGWIGSVSWTKTSSEQIAPFIDDIAAWAERADNKDVVGKPLLTSETGSCGIYGLRDRALAQWSEDYQSDYFTTSIRASMKNPRYCGVVLWQMFDTRSYVNAGDVRGKYRGFNNAGLLDEYRRPKLAFDEVRRLFHEIK